MKFQFTDFLDAKTIILSLGTIIGAYLGASQAGKYTLRSINEQKNIQDKKSIYDIEIQAIKFHESYKRAIIFLSFYTDMYLGYHADDMPDLKSFEEYAVITYAEIPSLFNSRLEELRKYSLELKMDREYEVLLMQLLENLSSINNYLRRWRPYSDTKSVKAFEEMRKLKTEFNKLTSEMDKCIYKLKKKHYK